MLGFTLGKKRRAKVLREEVLLLGRKNESKKRKRDSDDKCTNCSWQVTLDDSDDRLPPCGSCGKGHNVTAVTDSIEALGMMDKTTYDLVITDIMMPKLNGIDLTAKIKKKHPETKILAMSAGGHTGGVVRDIVLKQASSYGADEIIGKPFKEEEFISLVKDLLKKNRL